MIYTDNIHASAQTVPPGGPYEADGMQVFTSALHQHPPSLEALRQMSAFGALSDAVIEHLLERGDLLRLDTGELLYRKGEQADCFFIILDGHITVFEDDEESGRRIVRTTETGESVGFPAMIGLRPRLFNGEASCATDALRISSAVFAELHDRDPQQFAILFMNLSRDMSRFLRYSSGATEGEEAE